VKREVSKKDALSLLAVILTCLQFETNLIKVTQAVEERVNEGGF